MTEDEILSKFIDSKVLPSKYTISDVLGISVNTLVRKGIVVSDLQKKYKLATKEIRLCYCGNEINSKQNTYCSNSCSAKINTPKRRAIVNCRNCDKLLDNNNNLYCSKVCNKEYNEKQTIEKWFSGELSWDYKIPNAVRKYLFIKYNSKCSICGWNEVNPKSNKIPLEVEHIDGNSSNNLESNLTLLCPNCHSLTPTYKALNKGNGRHTRAQRYRDGKSY